MPRVAFGQVKRLSAASQVRGWLQSKGFTSDGAGAGAIREARRATLSVHRPLACGTSSDTHAYRLTGGLAARSSTRVRCGASGKNNVFHGRSPKVAVLPDDHKSRLRKSASDRDELIRRGHGETRSIEDTSRNTPQLHS